MKIVQLPQGGGKTSEMLVWLLEGHAKGIDRALIVTTQQERARLSKELQKLYNENGKPQYINNAANRIYTADTVRKNLRATHLTKCEIGIDDADLILMFLLGLHRPPSIIAVTDPPDGTEDTRTNLVVT